jgi:hypothetical protein
MSAFLDFCYYVRRPLLDEAILSKIDSAVKRFHKYRQIFQITGVRSKGFNLPRMHSMMHYRHLIEEFGAPGGLCTSITESKHIVAVKEPYRRSNRYEALWQMLVTNQRLDKISAARFDFERRGMLTPRSKNDNMPGKIREERQPENADIQDHIIDDQDEQDTEEFVALENHSSTTEDLPVAHDAMLGDPCRYPSDIALAKVKGEHI